MEKKITHQKTIPLLVPFGEVLSTLSRTKIDSIFYNIVLPRKCTVLDSSASREVYRIDRSPVFFIPVAIHRPVRRLSFLGIFSVLPATLGQLYSRSLKSQHSPVRGTIRAKNLLLFPARIWRGLPELSISQLLARFHVGLVILNTFLFSSINVFLSSEYLEVSIYSISFI